MRLDARAARLARRPMMVLGAIGPALLLAVVPWFAVAGFSAAVRQSNEALDGAGVADQRCLRRSTSPGTAANELERRYRAVDQVAASQPVSQAVGRDAGQARTSQDCWCDSSDPKLQPRPSWSRCGSSFRSAGPAGAAEGVRRAGCLGDAAVREGSRWPAWFFCDANGVSTVRVPKAAPSARISPGGAFLRRTATWTRLGDRAAANTFRRPHFPTSSARRLPRGWTVAISAPVLTTRREKKFLGVVAMTVEVGRFIQFSGDENQFAVWSTTAQGNTRAWSCSIRCSTRCAGQHGRPLPDRFKNCRVVPTTCRTPRAGRALPRSAGGRPEGGKYDRYWLARMEPVGCRGHDTGWIVIVQSLRHGHRGHAAEPRGQSGWLGPRTRWG